MNDSFYHGVTENTGQKRQEHMKDASILFSNFTSAYLVQAVSVPSVTLW